MVLIAVLPPASVVKLLNPLTIPPNVVVPPVLSVNADPPPLTVFTKLILPLVLEKVVAPVNVIGPFSVNELTPEAVIVPLALINPVD